MIRAVPHPLEILHGGGTSVCSSHTAELSAEELHGFFAGDTRVLSTYRFTIAGHAWRLLSRSRAGPSTAQWDMQNPYVRTPGGELPDGTVHLRLRRRVHGGMHDDLTVTSFAERPIPVRLALQIDADFADVFQVKSRSTPPRLAVQRVARDAGISFLYERQGFRRGLHVRLHASSGSPLFVGTQAVFDIVLEPGRAWSCCVDAVPDVDGRLLEIHGDPHAAQAVSAGRHDVSLICDPLLRTPFEQGMSDLDGLALDPTSERPVIAAGAPWFLALFGRDTLVTSLMSGMVGRWTADGALEALASTQARQRDDFRDAEPGKIAHELRRGELARFHEIPHTPYYGTHDAPALYVLALWNAFRWTGDRELVRRHLGTAQAALQWCDELGDVDGDGLLEYRTHSPKGYENQGWKDSGDAIVHEDGRHAELPIATVELQGYLYAARLAMAELLDALGESGRAIDTRASAASLRELVEERFWMEDAGCYALALDGKKRLVRSISSNPGHLLWCGLPSPARAKRVADRLLADDMFSGYGIRTLSARHRRYNPLSYQLGSVWPHDNALIAAGLTRYGLRDQAARVLSALLCAARDFEDQRLPELFCGFARDEGPPVPYEKANVPQAWAAAAPILATQLFLGLLPDAPNGRCYLSPWLPEWLPSIELVAQGLEISVRRVGGETKLERACHQRLEVVEGTPVAALWGAPQS